MNKIVTVLLTCLMHQVLHSYELSSSQEAYDFCLRNKKSFISIVWPIAQGKDDKIEQLFKQYGQVKYKKSFILNPTQAFYLLKTAHPHIPDMKAHVNWYFPPGTIKKPARVYVLVYKGTDQAVACKHAVRRLFKGLQYRSIHTNDTHQETMDLAQFFFGKKEIRRPVRVFTGCCLLSAKLNADDHLRFYLPVQLDTTKLLSA